MNQTKIKKLLFLLNQNYPQAHTALNYANPFQLLVATILSAQCTDKLVNQITPLLFEKYPDIKAFANAKIEELEQAVKKTGFFKNKARFIQKASKMLLEKFKGKVPKNMGHLTALPGIGRKTANVILYNAYGLISGIAVDTHVKRISFRLGLTKNTEPNKIEQDLLKILPQKYWGKFSHAIILHGRSICKARNPKCFFCFLKDLCSKLGVDKKA